jgi:glycosyltransferase involved in cell wall biosynthesis
MAVRLPALRPDRYRVISPPTALAHRAGHAWEQLVLPLRAARCALVYSPANVAPVILTNNVVVIHDAAALRQPGAYSTTYVAYHARVQRLLATRARLVITVSEFSRAELVALLGVPSERIRVIPPGVDERFAPGVDPEPVRARHGLTRPYVLALGTVSARKNFVALEAAARAVGAHGVDLVVAGADRRYMRGPQPAGRRLGYVSDRDLPALYAGALALAMPSLYEGFGLPCLEAMAAGVPVVASPRGALPETCGDAALLADPDDPSAFVTAVLAAAFDDTVRARLAAAGPPHAARYTWSRTVASTDEAIGELLAGE